MKTITCAGCSNQYPPYQTSFYRNKRWCGSPDCRKNIDDKVTDSNYKKRQRKIENGTFRNGVDHDLRLSILNRDDYICASCGIQDSVIGRMQVHHIIPVSHGGSDSRLNLITVCKPCHTIIHEKGWVDYVVSLKKTAEEMEYLLR
jgi:5-methylcytosine-specific restriction endonuclease McrA